MSEVTVMAAIKLAEGRNEADLLEASHVFQTEFVRNEPGILSRELVRKQDGTYLDIVRFRSHDDYLDVLEKEMESPACAAFFSVMDINEADPEEGVEVFDLLATY